MPDPKELTRLHENLNFHYPKSYLNAWAAGVRPDWATFLFKVFKVKSKIRNSVTMTAVIYLKEDVPALLDAENLSVMDLGCGPSICNIISASLCSHHIYMAELLEGNRKEIIKFLCNDTDAWNWAPYFEFQVKLLSGIIWCIVVKNVIPRPHLRKMRMQAQLRKGSESPSLVLLNAI